MSQLSQTVEVNGSTYNVVINAGKSPKPLQVYISKDVDHSQFGGYVYSISNKKNLRPGEKLTINQVILKNGENDDYNKSMGNLLLKKFDNPNYVNINNMDEPDFKPLVVTVTEIIEKSI